MRIPTWLLGLLLIAGAVLVVVLTINVVIFSEVSQKSPFPIGSAKALRHRVTICLSKNESHAKESGAVLISRSLRSCAAPP
jgi:hypothetical protein